MSNPSPDALKDSLSVPAKLNLFLYVLGKRPDGYHELFTCFHKVTLYDNLYLELFPGRGDVNIEVTPDDIIPTDNRNICFRAAKHFFDSVGHNWDVNIRIEKNIPVGAGMGGGSSDAAGVLLLLNSLCKAGLDQDALKDIGAELGADVPFFLFDFVSAIGTGTGTDIYPVTVPEFWYVLIRPNFSVSTAWVYNNFVLTTGRDDTIFAVDQDIKTLLWNNDLEKVVESTYPQIKHLKTALLRSGAVASLMTGSGSVVYGAFDNRLKAEQAKDKLMSVLKDLDIFLVKGLHS